MVTNTLNPDSSSVKTADAINVSSSLRSRRALRALEEPTHETIKSGKIMIVDDEPINIKVVQKYLQSVGYENFVSTSDATEALAKIVVEQPDVVVLDVMMPYVNGMEILEAVRADSSLTHIPVLILTASSDASTKLQALELGATDFLGKPVDKSELVVRIRNMLTVKAHHDHWANYSIRLEHEVRMRTAELEASRQEIIHVLACAAEYRDKETGNHVIRVGRFAGIIADELDLGKENVELIEQAAVLHDVGKIGISDTILLKPGKLDPGEIAMIQQHCEYGMNILRGVPCSGNRLQYAGAARGHAIQSPVLSVAATIAISHHEKWDGTGYPLGLSGQLIPIEGRITAVADVFDALSSNRPYKKAMNWQQCEKILKEGRGKHFDPTVMDAFFRRQDEILDVQQRYADQGIFDE